VLVIVLDRVFDSDDVRLVALFVDDVDHRCQRGGLARTGGAGHEHQPTGFVEKFFGRRRQPDLLHRQQLARDLAQHNAKISFLFEDADAEPCHFAEGKAEVSAAALAHVLECGPPM